MTKTRGTRGEEKMQKKQNEPVSIAVITREDAVKERLYRLISLWGEALCISYVCMAWTGTEASLPGPCPSIVFLDLASEDRGQIQGAAWLEEIAPSCALIILSDDQRQAIQAYQWHPVSCLSPGFSYGELCRTMDRCFRFWRQGMEWLDLPSQWDRVRIPLTQIHYAEGRGRDTILHCTGGEIRVSIPLCTLEPELPSPPFFRCQKSFVVHPDAVGEMIGGELIMKDRLAVSVSRNRKKDVQQLLEEWTLSRRSEG